MSALIAIIVLGCLVVVHEFGHFIVAKIFKVGVLEFSVGFGKQLWTRKFGETWYSLRAIPLGGFVSMAGEDPSVVYESKDVNKKNVENDSKKMNDQSSHEIEEDSYPKFFDEDSKILFKTESKWFLTKSVWKKFLIVLAGPVFNILFAFLLGMFVVFFWGAQEPVNAPIIGTIVPEYPAEKSGLKEGDEVLKVNGKIIYSWDSLSKLIGEAVNGKVELDIKRIENGKEQRKKIHVVAMEDTAEFKAMAGEGSGENDKKIKERLKIGIMPKFEYVSVSAIEAPLYSASKLIGITVLTYRGFKGLIEGLISTKHLGGPIEIVKTTARESKKGMSNLLDLVVFISMTLAIMNLLPIPVLDGGHLLFFFIEFCIRRPVPLKIQMAATQVGMFLLFFLMVFATGNDIMRLFN